MKVNYIKTVGFRKFKRTFETDLYNLTNITGRNRSGKTNVLYAIINILLGTNLSGDEKACLINKNCDSSYGELHFTDNNGINHALIRSKNRYSNKDNFLSLDGRMVTQTELMSFYKDKKLFLSIINPLYFINKKTSEQKELVDKYLSDIKPITIFERLNISEQEKLINKYYKNAKPYDELTRKEQEDFINLNIINICMDIAYDNLNDEEKRILEIIPSDVTTYITELNRDIKKLENAIVLLDGKIEYAQNIANTELPKLKTFEKDEELELAKQELVFLNTNKDIINKEKQKQLLEKLEKDILSKETECQELETAMKSGKKKYLAIKNGESCICPTCNQHLTDESKNITIENMKKELVAFYDKKNLLVTKLKDLKFKISIERCQYHVMEGNTTIEKNKRIAVVKENIKNLENEKLEIDRYNNEIVIKEKNIKLAKLDIEKFSKDKQSYIKIIDNTNKAKRWHKNYIFLILKKR